MSKVQVATDRFWNQFKPEVAGTLSDDQKQEIERVITETTETGSEELSDLRLSLKWFFIRLMWGPERRSPERIKQEQEMHPVMAPRNAPTLAALLAGYAMFLYVAFGILTLGVVYYLSYA